MREFLCVNAFFISKDWVLRRVSLGVKRLEIVDDSIKTAKLQAAAIRVRSTFS